MVEIFINKQHFILKRGISILEACRFLGIQVPRFCYHELLSIAGNCRMCFVEIDGLEKPVASCVMEIENGMSIKTNSPFVKKARENVVEMLLINHPLDCPICDQGGECDLQDETESYSTDYSRYFYSKRAVEDKNMGGIIKTVMTRCIHCTRCVRYFSEIAGTNSFGTLGRGRNTEIGGYVQNQYHSLVAGNVIDLCPVGALTSEISAFKGRPWELESIEKTSFWGENSIEVYSEVYNNQESERIQPRSNSFFLSTLISDKTRYSLKRVSALESNISSSKIKLTSERSVFLVSETLEPSILARLSLISNSYPDNISIKFLNGDCLKENEQLKATNNLYELDKSDLCVLIGCDASIENPLLDVLLREKIRNRTLSLYLIGPIMESSYPVEYISYDIAKGINTLLLKTSRYYSEILNSKRPVFIIGKQIFSLGLKRKLDALKIAFVNSEISLVQTNTVSRLSETFPVNTFSSRDLRNVDNIFFVNMSKDMTNHAIKFTKTLKNVRLHNLSFGTIDDVENFLNKNGVSYLREVDASMDLDLNKSLFKIYPLNRYSSNSDNVSALFGIDKKISIIKNEDPFLPGFSLFDQSILERLSQDLQFSKTNFRNFSHYSYV